MSSRPSRRRARALALRITAAAAIAAASAGCGPLTALRPPGHQPPSPTPAASRPAPAGTPLTALLPLSPARIQAAAQAAAGFAALYGTSPPGGSQGWLARLRPLATSGLYAALARGAAVPGALPRASAARVTGEEIRALTAASVIFALTLRPNGPGSSPLPLAVTVVPAGTGWLTYDVEPADAGDTGGP